MCYSNEGRDPPLNVTVPAQITIPNLQCGCSPRSRFVTCFTEGKKMFAAADDNINRRPTGLYPFSLLATPSSRSFVLKLCEAVPLTYLSEALVT